MRRIEPWGEKGVQNRGENLDIEQVYELGLEGCCEWAVIDGMAELVSAAVAMGNARRTGFQYSMSAWIHSSFLDLTMITDNFITWRFTWREAKFKSEPQHVSLHPDLFRTPSRFPSLSIPSLRMRVSLRKYFHWNLFRCPKWLHEREEA